jgi:membrane protein YdbS with pleckstrin-like domain
VAIPLIPLWLLGVGQALCAKRYEHLMASLPPRALHISSGFLFEVEKHIPLDEIQDLSLREGPILRRLGLAALTIETAGHAQQGMLHASLAGLVDAVAFRDAVLEQRDKLDRGA